MDKPVVAGLAPAGVSLEADKQYFWCTCGRSASQPFCDGTHRDTAFTPMPFSAAEAGRKFLCLCKQTTTPPYCDGSHKGVSAD